MDPVLDLLVQALGEAEGRRVWGTFRLAQTAVEAQRQAVQQAPATAEDTATTD